MNLGSQRNLVTVENPTQALDSDGGFIDTFAPASQAEWWAAIDRAGVRASERFFAGTVLSRASYILRGRFHEEISSESRLSWTDRAGVTHMASVLDVTDPEGAGVESIVLVSEVAS